MTEYPDFSDKVIEKIQILRGDYKYGVDITI